MKARAVCVAAMLAAFAAVPVSAQIKSATPYGQPGLFQTPFDPVLILSLEPSRSLQSLQPAQLVLTGGFQGDPGALLISADSANIPFGNAATIYVAAPALAVPGVYDQNGQMTVTLDPYMPALRGVTLYFQGVHVMLSGGGQLSNGMQLVFES